MSEQGKTGIVVWTLSSPYVFVGGQARSGGNRHKVQALVGWRLLARNRSQPRRPFPSRRARSIPVLPEM